MFFIGVRVILGDCPHPATACRIAAPAQKRLYDSSVNLADDNPVHGATEAAIQRLVDKYGGQLYSLAFRFCGSRDEAEDLVQEVFLQAFRSWGAFRGDADPKTWLFRIAANACQRMHRKKSGEPEHIGSLESLLPFGDRLIAVVAGERDNIAEHEEMVAHLVDLINRAVDPRKRAVDHR